MKNNKIIWRLLRAIMIFTLAIFSFSTTVMAIEEKWTMGNIDDYGLPAGSVGGIINMIATWLVGMFALFGIIGFTVSGIMYLVSTGNDDMISKAKKYMTYSLVGVIVGISGYIVIKAVDLILNASPTF